MNKTQFDFDGHKKTIARLDDPIRVQKQDCVAWVTCH